MALNYRTVALRVMQRFVGESRKMMSIRWSLVLGLVIMLSSGFLYVFWDGILDTILDWQMQLKEGKLLFNAWLELPFPLRIKVHVFQIKNGRDFQEGRAWPQVSEVGPFYFHEYRKREVHSWSMASGVVRYSEHLKFQFDESKSVAPLSRRVTVVNTPLFLILGFVEAKVKDFYLTMFAPVVNNIIVLIFRMFNENLVEDRTVEDVLNGREVGILRILNTVTSPLKELGIAVPSLNVGLYKLSESSFGFIQLRDNQVFGPSEVYTGQTSIGKFNYFKTIDDKRELKFYRSYCNNIKGTDGTFFGTYPPSGSNSSIYLFNQHLCRPLRFNFEKESIVQQIYTHRYQMDYTQFSILSDPRNWCFCPKDETVSRCEGVLFMRQCLDGAPLVLSLPHFYKSSRLLAKVKGLNPDPEKHLGYLEIERTLGTTTEASLRVQLNLDMKPYSAVPRLSNFRPVIMPYVWIDEGAVIEGYLKYLISASSIGMQMAEEGFIIVGAIGSLLIMKGLANIAWSQFRESTKVKPKQSDDDEDFKKNNREPNVIVTSENNTNGNGNDRIEARRTSIVSVHPQQLQQLQLVPVLAPNRRYSQATQIVRVQRPNMRRSSNASQMLYVHTQQPRMPAQSRRYSNAGPIMYAQQDVPTGQRIQYPRIDLADE